MRVLEEIDFIYICNLLAGRLSTEMDDSEIAVRDTLDAYLANHSIVTTDTMKDTMIFTIIDLSKE